MKTANTHTKKNTNGFTLIGAMIGTIVLAILVIGGAASLWHTQSTTLRQNHRHCALLIASSNMEQKIHDTGITALRQTAEDAGGKTTVTPIDILGNEIYFTTITVTTLPDKCAQVDIITTGPSGDTVTLNYQGFAND